MERDDTSWPLTCKCNKANINTLFFSIFLEMIFKYVFYESYT